MRRVMIGTLLSCILLVGCGFHLRGLNSQLSDKFKKTYLVENNRSDASLNQEIASLITFNGGKLVKQSAADVRLVVSPIRVSSREIAASGDNLLKEYEKIYRVEVTIIDQNDGSQIGHRTVSSRQTQQYDEKNILASDEEGKITQNAAIRDLANEIIRYLSIIK